MKTRTLVIFAFVYKMKTAGILSNTLAFPPRAVTIRQFKKNQTFICDIDFYAKRPYTNNMERLWGSSRFMSPEKFVLGAEIDEVTNVYTLGATAFALFADYDRTPEKWLLSDKRYDTANKAVSDRREKREQTIEQFLYEWGED